MPNLVKATLKAIGSGLIIGGLIILLIPSLRPAFNISVKDWLLVHTSQLSFSEAIKRAAPAVVNIYSITQHLTPLNQIEQRVKGLGSGVIVSHNGFIITNYHVISGADIIRVGVQDGTIKTASVVGIDPLTDLAVLHINAQDLPVIPIDLERATEVGDLVLAIGNPYNLGQTITQGIISASGRNAGLSSFGFLDYIQTDAAINDGNSGGALINSRGELVGINAANFNSLSDVQTSGISFAIPINLAYTVMKEIIKEGKVIRGYLGISGAPVSPVIARSLNLSGIAIQISTVQPGGPADQAGLEQGDIILEIDGKEFASSQAALHYIAEAKPNRVLVLTVLHKNQLTEKSVTVGELSHQNYQ